MYRKTIHLDEAGLKQMIREIINETAGANNDAIKIIETEIIPLLSKLRPYKSQNDQFFKITLTSIGELTLNILGQKSEAAMPYFRAASYNVGSNTLKIRGSRLNTEDWMANIKSDLLHEITHAINVQSFPEGSFGYAKSKKTLGLERMNDISKKIYELFDDGELNARRAQLFFDTQYALNTIPEKHKPETRDKGFVEKLINHLNPYHRLGEMKQIRQDLIALKVDYTDFPNVYEWSQSVNNTLLKTGNKYKEMYNNTVKQHSLQNNENELYNKLTKLTISLKKEVQKTLKAQYIHFYDKVKQLCEYMVSEYISHNYTLPVDMWHVHEQKEPIKRTPIFGE